MDCPDWGKVRGKEGVEKDKKEGKKKENYYWA